MSKIKNRLKDYLERVLILTPFIIVALLVVALIIFKVVVMITYGNTPITDVPAWVYWIMQPSGK